MTRHPRRARPVLFVGAPDLAGQCIPITRQRDYFAIGFVDRCQKKS